jgi:ankyrin repeat protein
MSRQFLRQRRIRWISFSLAAVAILLATYAFSPPLRLLAHSRQIRQIDQGAWVDARRYDDEWFDAARAGRIDILRALHVAHYPINSQTSAGYTAVILTAYDAQPDALDYLLRIGADPCRGDRNGNTALMGALYKGDLAIARRLVQAHCPIDQANNAGETALSFATLFGRMALLSELVARGANPNHVDARGDTPLDVALKQSNDSAARALRSLGAKR